MPQSIRLPKIDPWHFRPEAKVKPRVLQPQVSNYATHQGGSNFLSLYQTQPNGFAHPWLFAHRLNAKAALHVIPVIERSDGRQFLHMIFQAHPTLDMLSSLMFPSGLWGDEGDPNEPIAAVIGRELKEESGYELTDWGLLHSVSFLTSPGMTTEQKVLAIAKVRGQPSAEFRTDTELLSIKGTLDVPVEQVADPKLRAAWMADLAAKGIVLNVEVPGMLGLVNYIWP